jgi:hypothetical protein
MVTATHRARIRRSAALAVLSLLVSAPLAAAQGETGFLRGRGNFDLVFTYGEDRFEERIGGGPGAALDLDVERRTYSLYAAYGVTDRLDLVVNPTYAEAELVDIAAPDEEDFQDLTTYVKWRVQSWDVGPGRLSWLLAPGVKVPLADYQTRGVLALGGKQTDVRARAIGHYATNDGRWYASLETGYDFRTEDPPDEFPLHVQAGVRLFELVTVAPFYSRVDSLGENDQAEGAFTGSGEDFERYGVNVFVGLGRHFGIAGSYRISDDGRPTGTIPGYSVGLVLRW